MVFLIPFGLSAQYTDSNPFVFNTLSAVNPAYSGLESKVFANLQYMDQMELDKGNSIQGIADVKLKKLHGALGVNYNYFKHTLNSSRTFKLNYNYQIAWTDEHMLSLGVSAGIDNVSLDGQLYSLVYSPYFSDRYSFAFLPYYGPAYLPAEPTSFTRFKPGFGVVYRCKRFLTGVSLTNHIAIFGNEYRVNSDTNQLYWDQRNESRIHAFVTYRMNVFKWIRFEPILSYQHIAESGKHNLTTNLDFVIADCVKFGGQASWNMSQFYNAFFYMGLEVNKRVHLNFARGLQVSPYNNQSLGEYHISLAYVLK